MIKNILTIAGSDPSGGAGIQADLKTFSALGCFGMAAITALTAQNTQGVTSIHEAPADFVAKQITAIFDDIRVDAVKIGMVGNPEIIDVIAAVLKKFKPPHVVLDPVMVAQSGDKLISDTAIATLKTKLIPLCTVLTPNIPEANILLGKDIEERQMMAQEILNLGSQSVFLKGGHDTGIESNDIYCDANQTDILTAKRIDTQNNHGTGCTLSSAVACFLARGQNPKQACQSAKNYVTNALSHADQLDVGEGHGPVHHLYALWD